MFFTSSGYIDIWNNKREKELILSREEVLSSWINHFVKKESISKEPVKKEAVTKELIQTKKELVVIKDKALNKDNIILDFDSSDESENEYDENKLVNDMVERDIKQIKNNFTYFKQKKCIKLKTDKEYIEHFSKLLIKKLSQIKY